MSNRRCTRYRHPHTCSGYESTSDLRRKKLYSNNTHDSFFFSFETNTHAMYLKLQGFWGFSHNDNGERFVRVPLLEMNQIFGSEH